MNIKLITLIIYAFLALAATVVLGRNLYRNGEVFIANLFPSHPHMVSPVNNILLVGFYLVNAAFVLLYLAKDNSQIDYPHEALAFLTHKLGFVFCVLGIWHYVNIAILLSTKFILKKHTSWRNNLN